MPSRNRATGQRTGAVAGGLKQRERPTAKPKAKPIGAKKRASPKSRYTKPRTGNPSRDKKAASTINPRNKTEACLALLARPEGATIEELQAVTGWQPHSVRGLLAGTIKKIPGLALSSEKPKDSPRRYRVRRAAG
jgi:hypothetical protein